ncbi:N-(5'-phosphoribosyl)anthranilate isomerase [Gemmobacter straminiformis]|uniref:N-(5'-phosphoribosyl)anthranilate isomerase n=2 Tax=Paragemmobacter straminiformis TaxID=2045119 RepID=A0A842I5S1_9RHOB|nr:N-(5'-phosphoribosyl)anthranilate isomerase [Gemmobacter straminiformis]
MQMSRLSTADTWIRLIFSAKAADGHVIRRNVDWIDREVGRDRFLREVRARGFHLIQTSDQFIVVCHSGAIHLLF